MGVTGTGTTAHIMHPYLSVVAASRNDDHGGDPLHRTQIFINCLAQQCAKHKLPAELILVDWNPVSDRPGLAEVLVPPPPSPYFRSRVITVPTVLHSTIRYSDRLGFFQMIAKNVGIRRAEGKFVLATNIDIIFSEQLIAFLARKTLHPKRMYRVDRYDIKAEIPSNLGADLILDKAWNHVIRTNRRANLQEVIDPIYGHDPFCRNCEPHIGEGLASRKIDLVKEDGHWQLRPHPRSPIEHLNTNACGDFTLLSKEAWAVIRGYPDFEAFSFNVDSVGFVMAHYEGFYESSLLPPCVCFHIEHGLGSGYTPEGAQKLFDRLRAKRILNPEWPVLNPWVAQMREQQKAIRFNRENWGLADYELPERPLGAKFSAEAIALLEALRPIAGSVGSLYPSYDLDSATLFHERESRQPHQHNQTGECAAAKVASVASEILTLEAAAAVVAAESRGTGCGHIFDHELDSYSLEDHYGVAVDRPILVWDSPEGYERVRSVLEGRTKRTVVAGGEALSPDSLDCCDSLLLATDPWRMMLDLHRLRLLVPSTGSAEVAIWVLDSEAALQPSLEWSAAVNLARRLLSAAGRRVSVECQRELH